MCNILKQLTDHKHSAASDGNGNCKDCRNGETCGDCKADCEACADRATNSTTYGCTVRASRRGRHTANLGSVECLRFYDDCEGLHGAYAAGSERRHG